VLTAALREPSPPAAAAAGGGALCEVLVALIPCWSLLPVGASAEAAFWGGVRAGAAAPDLPCRSHMQKSSFVFA
jgi:hypothetical protein